MVITFTEVKNSADKCVKIFVHTDLTGQLKKETNCTHRNGRICSVNLFVSRC